MDIGNVADISTIQAAQLRREIDIAVLAKTHDAAKLMGQAAVDLIESAAELSQQSNDGHVDITA